MSCASFKCLCIEHHISLFFNTPQKIFSGIDRSPITPPNYLGVFVLFFCFVLMLRRLAFFKQTAYIYVYIYTYIYIYIYVFFSLGGISVKETR